MSKIIDARGLSCPQPVILTKRAIDENHADFLITIVDNTVALENVSKLARSQGYDIDVEEKNDDFYINIYKSKIAESQQNQGAEDLAVLITSRLFGQGDEELGAILMRSFLYSLNEISGSVTHIIFMNSGVFLTTEGSPVIDLLQTMEAKGIEILSCGTCLDYYQLKDRLQAGKVTNMYTALDILSTAAKNITL